MAWRSAAASTVIHSAAKVGAMRRKSCAADRLCRMFIELSELSELSALWGSPARDYPLKRPSPTASVVGGKVGITGALVSRIGLLIALAVACSEDAAADNLASQACRLPTAVQSQKQATTHSRCSRSPSHDLSATRTKLSRGPFLREGSGNIGQGTGRWQILLGFRHGGKKCPETILENRGGFASP